MNIIQSLLTSNKYSRPQTSLKGLKAVVIHWVANLGSSVEGNQTSSTIVKVVHQALDQHITLSKVHK
ncbi:hypothetical protein [Bacillus safensis]|uniref:hypothetical protein n=1 Tax=Bacillus safensis TaxID=561879 RepID=UPI000DADE01E|nr:hypothetical protein [Bacillus safensis]